MLMYLNSNKWIIQINGSHYTEAAESVNRAVEQSIIKIFAAGSEMNETNMNTMGIVLCSTDERGLGKSPLNSCHVTK